MMTALTPALPILAFSIFNHNYQKPEMNCKFPRICWEKGETSEKPQENRERQKYRRALHSPGEHKGTRARGQEAPRRGARGSRGSPRPRLGLGVSPGLCQPPAPGWLTPGTLLRAGAHFQGYWEFSRCGLHG